MASSSEGRGRGMLAAIKRLFESRMAPGGDSSAGARRMNRIQTVGEIIYNSEVVQIMLDTILRVANQVEPYNPPVAYLCRFYAFEKAHRLDPTSSGHGVREFKISLLQRIERENDPTLKVRVKKSDASEIESFYQHYIQALQNYPHKADQAQLTRAHQTAAVLFEVAEAVIDADKIRVDQRVVQTSEGETVHEDSGDRCMEFNILELIVNGSEEPRHLDLSILQSITENFSKKKQICSGGCAIFTRGPYYLHKDKGIVHMDLKSGNILLDDLMVPKITDFGLSRPKTDSLATTTRLISQGYTAPEYIKGDKATRKSDIYSLGVIITELVTGSRMKPNITKVIRRWNHRWIKSMKQSSLGYQQVGKCLELALRCIQDAPTDRPDISYIIDGLIEIDSEDGQTQIQISPCCLEDILGIEPLEIHISFEDLKISHSIELNNDTDDYIAFVTKAKLECFCTKPNRGIVPPRSKCSVTLAMEARVNARPNEHYTEVITVLSTRVDDEALATMNIVTVGDMFIDSEDGKVVDEVNVMVVFGRPEE